MRALLYMAFGAACGVIATVLIFTLDPSPNEVVTPAAGGGNARLTFDENALAAMLARQLEQSLALPGDRTVEVAVKENGHIDVTTRIAATGNGADFVLDPDILDGRLHVELASVDRAAAAAPAGSLSLLLEDPLGQRLEALADGFEYRLVAIQTTNHQLTLEVEVQD